MMLIQQNERKANENLPEKPFCAALYANNQRSSERQKKSWRIGSAWAQKCATENEAKGKSNSHPRPLSTFRQKVKLLPTHNPT
jgi:hypothetical protein